MIHQAILDLLNKYKLETAADYENALNLYNAIGLKLTIFKIE